MNIQHMDRDDRSGTVCGETQKAIPLGEVVAQCQNCLAIYQGKIPWPVIDQANPVTEPCIAVPEGFQGSAAEAIALAVAGAVQAIAEEGATLRGHLEGTKARLAALVAAYPQTSFAASESAKEEAVAWLAWLEEQDQPEPGT